SPGHDRRRLLLGDVVAQHDAVERPVPGGSLEVVAAGAASDEEEDDVLSEPLGHFEHSVEAVADGDVAQVQHDGASANVDVDVPVPRVHRNRREQIRPLPVGYYDVLWSTGTAGVLGFEEVLHGSV